MSVDPGSAQQVVHDPMLPDSRGRGRPARRSRRSRSAGRSPGRRAGRPPGRRTRGRRWGSPFRPRSAEPSSSCSSSSSGSARCSTNRSPSRSTRTSRPSRRRRNGRLSNSSCARTRWLPLGMLSADAMPRDRSRRSAPGLRSTAVYSSPRSLRRRQQPGRERAVAGADLGRSQRRRPAEELVHFTDPVAEQARRTPRAHGGS